MRFFYEISETKKHKVRVSPPFAKADESKVRFVNGESKSSKEEINLNHKNDSSCEKTAAEVVKNISDVKSEITSVDQTVSDKFKQTINDSLKCGDNNNKRQGFVEHKKESCEKLEGNTNVFETELKGKADEKTVESSQKDNLSDKSESGGIKAIDVKNKSEKTKAVKDVNANAKANSNVQDFKEKSLENNDQRLLLNPISGQLESVPSINQSKPNVKDEVSLQVEKQGSVETVKKFVPDQKSKKSLPEGIKEVKKSSVNLLKSFRKEKLSVSKEQKAEGKHVSDNALTITTVPKPEKSAEKDKANVSIEIKSEKKESEYDFDGTSPPSKIMPLQEYSKISKQQKHSSSTDVKQPQNNWMSLQDFRMQMLKQNNPSSDDLGKKDKRKSVPSLFRIGMESNKKSCPKTPNGKLPGDKAKTKKMSPTIINIKTEDEDRRKTEIKIELPSESGTPPKPIKIENKGGEYSIKPREEEPKKVVPAEKKSPLEVKKPEESKNKLDCNKSKDLTKVSTKRSSQEKPESENSKKSKPNVEETKNDNFGAIDLSKTDTSPRSGKNPLENLMDLASKSGNPKSDENMVEALISAAQKQSIEPLLKIPQYSQNVKNSSCQGSPPVAKNISSNDISQALQFFKDLRSDIKVLEAKSQLSPNSFLEQFSQKSANLEPIQLYQQHIDLIRRLKRQQMATAESETPQKKQPRFSPTSECTRKSSPDSKPKMTDEAAQLKSSLERTISQIQEQMELQSRIVAAQNYKNLPALLQFYNRPPAFCPGPPSPSKSSQNKLKSSHSPNSQKSPNSRKSPQSLTSPSSSLPLAMSNSEASFFNAQKYNHLINAGLNSEMTFHQMFQNYLNQQDKMNQIKHSQAMVKKPQGLPSAKTISDLYYGSQTVAKKPEPSSVSAVQKT